MNKKTMRRALMHLEQELRQIQPDLHNLPDPDLDQAVLRNQANRLERAILQLKAGGYGRCEFCDSPIPDERLQLFPDVTTCVGCQGLVYG